MELEFHQIDLRFEALRSRDPLRERSIAVSMAAIGQQTPVVVVAQASGNPILVDGFKRLRALRALRLDLVHATCWDMPEQEALLLGRLMRTTTSESPFEQGWLLRELRDRFGMTLEELGRRFDRTASWVCLALPRVRIDPDWGGAYAWTQNRQAAPLEVFFGDTLGLEILEAAFQRWQARFEATAPWSNDPEPKGGWEQFSEEGLALCHDLATWVGPDGYVLYYLPPSSLGMRGKRLLLTWDPTAKSGPSQFRVR